MALTEDASAPSAATGSGASTATSAFTPPDNSLLVAYCQGDANNGSLDEDQTVSDGTTWTKKVLRNGNGGACVTIHYRRIVGTSPGSLTPTLTDNKGSVAKHIFPRVYTDPATGIAPDIGATAVSGSASVSLTTTVNNSWVWSACLAANATLTAGTGCTLKDSFGGFNSGDAVATQAQTSTTPTAGTSVTNTFNGTATVPHNVAVEIIPGSSSSAPAFIQQPPRRIPRLSRRTRISEFNVDGQQFAPTVTLPDPIRKRPPLQRRAKCFSPPVPQPTVANPLITYVEAPRKGLQKLYRRARSVTPVPPQVIVPNPLITFTEAPRKGLQKLSRRPKSVTPVYPQAAPVNPLITFTEVPRRGLQKLSRRPKSVTPVPVQATPANPLITYFEAPRKGLQKLSRRPRSVTPVPPQEMPLDSVSSPRRGLSKMSRRAKIVTPPPPQSQPPTVLDYVKRLPRMLLKRLRIANPTPPQVVTPNPKITYTESPRRVAQHGFRRGRSFQAPALSTVSPPTIVPGFLVRTEVDTIIVVSSVDTVMVRTETDNIQVY